MLKRKRPKLKKRRLLDVAACRRRVKRSLAVCKLRRRQRQYQLIAGTQFTVELSI